MGVRTNFVIVDSTVTDSNPANVGLVYSHDRGFVDEMTPILNRLCHEINIGGCTGFGLEDIARRLCELGNGAYPRETLPNFKVAGHYQDDCSFIHMIVVDGPDGAYWETSRGHGEDVVEFMLESANRYRRRVARRRGEDVAAEPIDVPEPDRKTFLGLPVKQIELVIEPDGATVFPTHDEAVGVQGIVAAKLNQDARDGKAAGKYYSSTLAPQGRPEDGYAVTILEWATNPPEGRAKELFVRVV